MTRRMEKILIISAALLSLWSVIAIMSATLNYPGYENLYLRQALAACAGFVVLFCLKNFSYKFLQELSPLLFFVSLALLGGLFIAGVRVHGSLRWYNLGLVYFQPAEFAKFSFILFCAYVLERKNSILVPLAALGVLSGLIIIQPDAGTVFLFFPVMLGMLSISRFNVKWLGGIIILGLLSMITLFAQSYLFFRESTLIQGRFLLIPALATVLITAGFIEMKRINRRLPWGVLAGILILLWGALGAGVAAANSLREYQRRRIVSYMLPELDPAGTGYSTRQSLLAVGSGRVAGKGLFQGTQTQLGFIPARHNDFIFATIAEETGFLGAAALLFLLVLFAFQAARIINRTEDYGGRLIATGIFCLFTTQVVVNLFVALGLVPVMGTQLPFVSYGGSGMILFFSLTGVLLNINRRSEIIAK